MKGKTLKFLANYGGDDLYDKRVKHLLNKTSKNANIKEKNVIYSTILKLKMSILQDTLEKGRKSNESRKHICKLLRIKN